jgi:hypothetical protein
MFGCKCRTTVLPLPPLVAQSSVNTGTVDKSRKNQTGTTRQRPKSQTTPASCCSGKSEVAGKWVEVAQVPDGELQMQQLWEFEIMVRGRSGTVSLDS